jgi:hypothetical protein
MNTKSKKVPVPSQESEWSTIFTLLTLYNFHSTDSIQFSLYWLYTIFTLLTLYNFHSTDSIQFSLYWLYTIFTLLTLYNFHSTDSIQFSLYWLYTIFTLLTLYNFSVRFWNSSYIVVFFLCFSFYFMCYKGDNSNLFSG